MAVELRTPNGNPVRIDGMTVTPADGPARTLAAGEVMTAGGWILTGTASGDVQVDAGSSTQVTQSIIGTANSVTQIGSVGDVRFG